MQLLNAIAVFVRRKAPTLSEAGDIHCEDVFERAVSTALAKSRQPPRYYSPVDLSLRACV